ncbi:type II toxin-antitoxin system ParD family antitoxin [Rhizobium sp. L1K21]|uniref:type II toxin-antitoxin system ParD family antitoxin n=1 Tax=Rhizobium sp. L1K21 TaxID=2954933 RepID=UPI002093ED57|nr:type II toxin-antitoxin system ParD family antitoxin [Rhizobium sp. L1K21]MCO6188511.1 type II toxin-antitoxin system ParD family antitoxin [Rhizobium sp. L1K21]
MPAAHARNVALTPQLSSFVDDLVASGEYANASEVLREGLRVLKERREVQLAELTEIRTRIAIGVDQLDRGEGVALTAEQATARIMANVVRKRTAPA